MVWDTKVIKYKIWLGILNTFRTLYFEEIINYKYKIEELNLEFVS